MDFIGPVEWDAFLSGHPELLDLAETKGRRRPRETFSWDATDDEIIQALYRALIEHEETMLRVHGDRSRPAVLISCVAYELFGEREDYYHRSAVAWLVPRLKRLAESGRILRLRGERGPHGGVGWSDHLFYSLPGWATQREERGSTALGISAVTASLLNATLEPDELRALSLLHDGGGLDEIAEEMQIHWTEARDLLEAAEAKLTEARERLVEGGDDA